MSSTQSKTAPPRGVKKSLGRCGLVFEILRSQQSQPRPTDFFTPSKRGALRHASPKFRKGSRDVLPAGTAAAVVEERGAERSLGRCGLVFEILRSQQSQPRPTDFFTELLAEEMVHV